MGKYEGFSENELIALLKNGDKGALRPIYNKHIIGLYHFVLRIAKSSQLAEDVVQDVFVKIWDSRLTLDSDLPIKPYLYTVPKRHLINLIKRAKHEYQILEEIKRSVVIAENTTDMEVDFRESNALYATAINQLPPQCKEVFVLCKIQGMSYKQVAEQLKITEGTVNGQMVKALKIIRAYLTLKNTLTLILLYLNSQHI